MRKKSFLRQTIFSMLVFMLASVQYADAQDAREQPIGEISGSGQEQKTEQTYVLANAGGIVSIPDYESAFFTQEVTEISPTELRVTIRLSEPKSLKQPYPVQSVSPAFQQYLEPTPHIQSDHTEIEAVASQIKSNANAATQQALVEAVLQWNREHLRWSRPNEIPDAITALNQGSGNCIAFAHLPAAILRNLGVPARTSRVFIAHPEANVLVRHYLLEVYYPADNRWVTYEPQLAVNEWQPRLNYLYMYHDADWNMEEHRRTRPFSEDPQTQIRYGRQQASIPVRAAGTQLPVPQGPPDLLFGGSLASNGQTIAAGAFRGREPWPAILNGETYLYQQDAAGQWKAQQVIRNKSPEALFHAQVVDYNGTPLANRSGASDFVIHGNYALAGTKLLKTETPAILKKEDDRWITHQQLDAPAGVTFGDTQQTFALSPNVAVVAVRRNLDEQRGYETCEAYVYEKDQDGSWNLGAKLPSVGDPHQYEFEEYPRPNYKLSLNCQNYVAASDHNIVIGTHYRAEWGIPDSRGFLDVQPAHLKNKQPLGKVVIFSKQANGQWTKADSLRSSEAESRDCLFPSSLALDQNRLAVGANSCSYDTNDFVNIYSQSGDSWEQTARIEAPESIKKYRLNFATDLALHNDLVGTASDFSTSASSFAEPIAHIFREEQPGSWKPVKEFKGFGQSVDFREGAFAVEGPEHSALLSKQSEDWKTEAKLDQYRTIEKEYWMRPPSASLDGNRMLLEERAVGVHEQPYYKDNSITLHKTHPVAAATLYEQDNTGQWIPEITFRIPSEGRLNKRGSAVALHGNHAAVGGQGAVYLFVRRQNGWSREGMRIKPSDSSYRYSYFGESVAISGNTMVVGASDITLESDEGTMISEAGAAFVFEGQGTCWKQVAVLRLPVLQEYSSFGRAVAIDQNSIVVGAPEFDGSREKSGAAYLFEKGDDGNWKFTQALSPGTINKNDYLGSSVALQHGVAVVGAYGSTAGRGVRHRGSAYAFRRGLSGDWTQVAIIGSRQAQSTEFLGHPVAFKGGQVILGSKFGRSQKGTANGTAYVESFSERGAVSGSTTHPLPRCEE